MSYKCRSPCKSSKKKKQPKERNWLAVHAFQRSGAGAHTDKKKKRNKRACRGKVKQTNYQEQPMLPNQLIPLLSFRAFTSGSRQDDISVNPANIQYISTSNRSLTVEGRTYRPTTIHLMNCSIEVAQSREFIEFQVNRTREPDQEYIQDISRSIAAK